MEKMTKGEEEPKVIDKYKSRKLRIRSGKSHTDTCSRFRQ